MQRTILVCDVCGTEQGQGNHWFVITLIDAPRRLMLGPLGSEDSILGENKLVLHLCGEGCVTKTVSEFLGTRQARRDG